MDKSKPKDGSPSPAPPGATTKKPGHVSPQIDESSTPPDRQIAQTKEQSSGQGSGQS